MKRKVSRRDSLKSLSLLGLSFGFDPSDYTLVTRKFSPRQDEKINTTSRKLTAITCGAGARGNTYGNYALKYPGELDIIGVAEPIEIRRKRYAEKHDIPTENVYYTWEQFFERDKFADIVIITTPDDLHHGPAMSALEKGYDVLLEKPIAQTWKECRDILKKQKEKDAIVAVCHVLRYAPYYRKVKSVMDSGLMGQVVSLQHFEPIEHAHMAHSFVRGNWRRKEDTNPIILAKSCHDLDIMRWWLGVSCHYVSSFGSLSWFTPENAPMGSSMRCTDGCAIESECPYSALRIYHRERQRLHVFDLSDNKSNHGDEILKKLNEGPYGRCVYHCDNNVADHQIVAMEFDGGVTASFNMEAFTNYMGRRTRIMGSMGCMAGDEEELMIANFRTKEVERWITRDHADDLSGHGGGDYALMRDFLHAVDKHDVNLLTSNLDASMESHLMAFLAEESRDKKAVMRCEVNS